MKKIAPRHSSDEKSLDLRFGYTASDAAGYWGKLEAGGRAAERRFLKVDLLFPFVYGGALLIAGQLLRSASKVPVPAIWIVLPVLLLAMSDWIENLAQLHQLDRFSADQPLQSSLIAVASAATIVKLSLIVLTPVGLVALLLHAVMARS